MREASGESTSTLSPQFVLPLKGPLPVATTSVPFEGSTAAPLRDQIAESLASHELGVMIAWRSLQSEFQTCRMRPVRSDIVTTCPWYGGASPMYPPVAMITSPRLTLIDGVIFSCVGSRVRVVVQSTLPSETRSLRTRPSGAA